MATSTRTPTTSPTMTEAPPQVFTSDERATRGSRSEVSTSSTAPDALRPSRSGGYLAIAGATIMVAGAVCHSAFGADIFVAMESEDRAEVARSLTDVAGNQGILTAGTFLWILGACTMCAAGTLIARRAANQWANAARWAFAAATGAVIVFFSAMVGIVERLAPAHARGEDVITLVQVVGKGAATADWITTALILGVGYGAVVFSGRSTWAPRWLQYLAGASVVAGIGSVVTYTFGSTVLGYVDVIVGLATVVATGIVAARHGD